MASEHHHLQLEKPPYPKVERPQVGRIKQRAERSNHKINLCAIRTSIGRDLGGPHLSIIQGGPELEVLFLACHKQTHQMSDHVVDPPLMVGPI